MRPYIEHVSSDDSFAWRLEDYHATHAAFEWHYHWVYELVLHRNFKGKLFAGAYIADMRPNSLALYGPRLPHTDLLESIDADKPTLTRVLWFSPQWINTIVEQLPEYRPLAELLRDSRQGMLFSAELGELAATLLDGFDQLSPMQQSSRILALLVALAEQGPAQVLNPGLALHEGSETDRSDRNEEKLERIVRFIDNNYRDELCLDDLAEHLHISRSSVQRLFKKHLLQSFSEHLNQYRIGKACEFLVNTDQPIAVISQTVGFANLSNFNRQFKKHKHMTPKVFREMFRR